LRPVYDQHLPPFHCINLRFPPKKIKAWFVDIDGSKERAFRAVARSPLFPSKIVETKNGLHIYFSAIQFVQLANQHLSLFLRFSFLLFF
jgi:hypothetical protein